MVAVGWCNEHASRRTPIGPPQPQMSIVLTPKLTNPQSASSSPLLIQGKTALLSHPQQQDEMNDFAYTQGSSPTTRYKPSNVPASPQRKAKSAVGVGVYLFRRKEETIMKDLRLCPKKGIMAAPAECVSACTPWRSIPDTCVVVARDLLPSLVEQHQPKHIQAFCHQPGCFSPSMAVP